MTLPSTGTLSLNEIRTEFGGTSPMVFSEYYRGGARVSSKPVTKNSRISTSGEISISMFYGAQGGYTPGSISWYTVGNYIFNVPMYVDTINVTGTAGGGGGGGISDDACDPTIGGAGGGSSGQMLNNQPFSVTPGESLSVRVGAGGAQTVNGQPTYIGSIYLYGGNRGQGGSPCGGTAYAGGVVPGGGPTGYFGYNGSAGYCCWGGGAGGSGFNGYGGGGQGGAGKVDGGGYAPGYPGAQGYLSVSW